MEVSSCLDVNGHPLFGCCFHRHTARKLAVMVPRVYDWLMLVFVSVKAEFPYQPAVFCCISHAVPLLEVEDALTVTVNGICLLPSTVRCE